MNWERYARDEEAAHTPPSEISVDLKWSCWLSRLDDWEELEPEAVRILRTFPEYLKIHTAPKKEIRYGTVTIQCDGDQETCTRIDASGHFYCEWDEPEALVDTLDLPDDEATMEAIHDSRTELMPRVEFHITEFVADWGTPQDALDEVMRRVDRQEDHLLELDSQGWEAMEAWAKSYAADSITRQDRLDAEDDRRFHEAREDGEL